MDFKGKKIVVIGMGKTGIAAAGFLGRQGATVIVTDEKSPDQWGDAYRQIAEEKWLETGDYHDASILNGATMVVPSPGIPPNNPLLVEALKKNITVFSEIELAYRLISVPIIAVTGTNGKTTTTTLLGEIFRTSGKKVFVGGNIGNPLIEYAETAQQDDFVVAEISSFQLQWIEQFKPFIAVLLNITCDHINYHGSFDEYRRVKASVFARQTKNDFAILNAEDQEQEGISESINAQICKFSSKNILPEGIFIRNETIVLTIPQVAEESYPLDMIHLPGAHNVENVMAAITAARLCGCSRENIIASIKAFRGLPHRIEFAGEKKSIKFYDDSKGTNVGSVLRALETFEQPVILLLGGRDKDGDFETLRPLLKTKTKHVILFGEARERIASLISEDQPLVKKETLKEAVESAYQNAKAGDIVLLSPGCASFDEFTNYKERGNYFKEVVRNL
ncbi:MAG TPA: UDP-N-acetylmuramoyl-L-alanine--D-glutamate ligase [Smithella sp.]|nr:UDP-N-acetylmuramoyl-L-alanine--D-glutamate ligase [Smithella sp.]MDM7986288.1 UDP-N-acetylmuramoyl-L-alanine--D-glutamate ligase [Smithella sp.]HNY49571.1 UDP-N-acetylmuramoyl-L-alanine--D-glutamate ligase [Smithella sp.]HOG89344.1 UDP-N-acetylmuramoyl-L-alanine--D-glutamate ligase [Smithella sp.]HOU50122.1 UDP-N-acetylmuramoyl-L-alanine--D-glutamate ligase [Smithella sp.]